MALPANVDTGKVEGRFVVGVIDGPDPDDEPDAVPAKGTVTFTASVPYLPNPVAAPAPVTILKAPIVGVLDAEGYLCARKPDGTAGARGVRLVATDDEDLSVQGWTWTVTYTFENVNGTAPRIASHSMALPAGATIDLTSVVKVPSSTGIGIEQAEALAASAQEAATVSAAAAQAASEAAQATDTGVASFIGLDAGTATTAALDEGYRRGFSVREFGAIGDGVADDTAAIQAAADHAYQAGPLATLHMPPGTYRTSGPLRVRCNLDASAADIRFYGTGTALAVGDDVTPLFDRTVHLPTVRFNTGAIWDGQSTGVEVVNLQASNIRTRTIVGFETGLRLIGRGSGFAYNNVEVGFLNTNHRNLVMTQSGGGWANQNTIIGGRFQVINSRGATMGDLNCHHVLLQGDGGSVSGPNNNTFLGCSFEGWDYTHYRAKLVGARYNTFYNCRWEVYGTPAKAFIRAENTVTGNSPSSANLIHRGYDSWKIVSEADETSTAVAVETGMPAA